MAAAIHKLLSLFLFFIFFLSSSERCSAVTSRVDIEALIQLKAAIDPSTLHSSSCLGSWDFSVDPCDSSSSALFVCGISCNVAPVVKEAKEEAKEEAISISSAKEVRRVTGILLDGYGYRGTLSPFVGNLSALQVLDVSGNDLSGQLPNSIGNLRRLTRLELTGNRFSASIPGSIGRLALLEHLGLARNAFSGQLPDSLARLDNLRHLYVYSNQLSGPLPSSMRSMSSLLYLDASANLLSGSLQDRLPPSLVQLSLRGNKLQGDLPALNLRQMVSLEVLDLSRNSLSGAIDGTLICLHPSLQQVNLAWNRFELIQSPSSALMISSRMVALDASFNRIRGTLPSFLAGLPRLSSLSLRGNAFGGVIPLAYAIKAVESLVGIQPLERLYLDGNFLVGSLPPPLLTFVPGRRRNIVASFANNCLDSCPITFPFCQGGAQKAPAQCRLLPPP